jgi:hypothetical protein
MVPRPSNGDPASVDDDGRAYLSRHLGYNQWIWILHA